MISSRSNLPFKGELILPPSFVIFCDERNQMPIKKTTKSLANYGVAVDFRKQEKAMTSPGPIIPYPSWLQEIMDMWNGFTTPHLEESEMETTDDYSERVPDPHLDAKVHAICMEMIKQHLDPTPFVFSGYINRAGGPMVPITETPKLFVREFNEWSKQGVGELHELGTITNANTVQIAVGSMRDHYDLDGK